MQLQLNPDIAHLKGLVKIMLYTKDFTIANIEITIKMLLWTKICMLYWRKFVISGCAIAGFQCTSWSVIVPFDNLLPSKMAIFVVRK